MPTPSRPPRPTSDLVSKLGHLQPRDRLVLTLLAEHRVLTTPQVTALFFSSLRMCQHRLHTLHRLGFLDRFRPHTGRGGSQPWHWALGPLGLHLHAAAHRQPAPSPKAIRERLDRLAADPRLSHLLGCNQFFVDLHAHARTHPATRLVRWWSEQHTTALFRGVHPDGHGLWTAQGRTVGFFLEYDTGSENLDRVIAKLTAYQRLAHAGGPTYPVLLWLHSTTRETHLHDALAGARRGCPVATAVRDTTSAAPAGPVWRLPGDPTRRWLHELPCDHGADSPINPNWRHGRLILDQGDGAGSSVVSENSGAPSRPIF